jgi:DNA-binding NarL/FixJ family response regulator
VYKRTDYSSRRSGALVVELGVMHAKIRILVADDHVAIRQMLRTTLDSQADMEVVAEAADGAETVRLAHHHLPQVLLLDAKMAGEDGIRAAKELVRTLPRLRILMLTAQEEEKVLFAALEAGVHGFLLKSASVEQIIDAIRVVAGDGAILSPRSASQLIGQFRQRVPSPIETDSSEEQTRVARLTGRELEVLNLLCAGLNNRDIAEKLFISELTVKTHVQNLLRRLEARDRFQAAAIGIRLGFGRSHENEETSRKRP